MRRFVLTEHARHDLDDLERWLDGIPRKPAKDIALAVAALLGSIARDPYIGSPNSEVTRLLGEEVRTRFAHPFRVYYLPRTKLPEIIAILHHARDSSTILLDRLQ